jgi:hypothetical protein
MGHDSCSVVACPALTADLTIADLLAKILRDGSIHQDEKRDMILQRSDEAG